MGEVITADDQKIRLSISRLAAEFGMARETVAKRLRNAGIRPEGKRDGYPVYRLRDAAPALIGSATTDGDGEQDPDRMAPAERRSWFQSERERINLEAAARTLIPAHEHEADVARMTKLVVQFCDTLPDVLERDLSLAPAEVVRVQELTDQLRAQLYTAAVSEGDDVRLSA